MTPAHLTATLPAATTLITAVREKDGPAIHRALFNCPLPALAITLAHLVPDDRSTTELLAWTQPGAQYKRADGTDMRDDPEPVVQTVVEVVGDPGGKCGTLPGYARHVAFGMNPCVACNEAHRQSTNKARRRQGEPIIEHGTVRGAKQHQYRNETFCEPCAAAWEASLAPHGTSQAMDRHRKHDEPMCDVCVAARDARAKALLAPCGTMRAIRRHRRWNEELCQACTDYVNRPRTRRREPDEAVLPCGTRAAAERHKYHKEPLDGACEEALRIYNSVQRRKRRAAENAA